MPRWNKRPRRKTPTPEPESDQEDETEEGQQRRMEKLNNPLNIATIIAVAILWIHHLFKFSQSTSPYQEAVFKAYCFSNAVVFFGICRRSLPLLNIGRYFIGLILCFVFVTENSFQESTEFWFQFALLFVYVLVHQAGIKISMALVGMKTEERSLIDRILPGTFLQ